MAHPVTTSTEVDRLKDRRDRPMTDGELTSFLGRKIYRAMNDEDGDLSTTRESLFDRYFGERYGTERDGYSTFTTREVLEAIEWAKPPLLRILAGGKKVVSFDPVSHDDEMKAEQETDVVNYKVLKSNAGDGWMALYDFIHESLLFPVGYIKVYVDEQEVSRVHKVTDVDAAVMAEFTDDPEREIIEQDSREVILDVPVPNPQDPTQMQIVRQPIEVFDLAYRETKTERTLRLESVPGEEALIDNNCTSLNLDEAEMVCHRTRKNYSELIRMGYDGEKLEYTGGTDDLQWNDERTNRLFYEDESPDAHDAEDYSMREYWVSECFVWIDYDGTGQAQFRRVVLIGNTIFENEEVDYQPLVGMSTIPIPHKHNGLSLGQLVESYQELLTVLSREMLDNLYNVNILKTFISEDAFLEDASTMEALMNRQAPFVPVQGLAADVVSLQPHQSILHEVLPAIQDARQASSLRSGISPQNNVDPAVIQQSNTGAFMGALNKAGERIEMIARIFAETGFKQLFRKVHQLIRMYPDIATTVKLRGQWVPVDASSWDERTDVTVNVGLVSTTGTKCCNCS